MAINIGKAVLEMNFTANSLPVEKKIVVEPMQALGKLFWRFRREWVFASKARGDESLGGKRRRIMGGRGRRDSLVTVAITSTILLMRRRWEDEKCVVVIVTRREPKTTNDVVSAKHNSERKEQSMCHNF
nr:hypothetical protein Iba_chr14dCG8820 [Ipomoea batatas]